MGLTKEGDIIQRCKFSKCQHCKYYIKGYKCWFNDYIPAMTYNGSDYPKWVCEHEDSTLLKVRHNEYVFKDYDNMPDPERGRFKFDSKGNKI